MKFLANMEVQQYMREFHNIVITLSKLSKECTMDIRSDKLYFMANEEQIATTIATGSAPLVWIEIDMKLYFQNYITEGIMAKTTATTTTHNNDNNNINNENNTESNRIMLTVSPLHLSRALNALKLMARSVKMKLINLQFPCLRIEVDILQSTQSSPHAHTHADVHDENNTAPIDHVNNLSNERQIVHDVPVTIIPRSDWSYYHIPQIPVTKFLIRLKSSRLMKNLIDKLKNISPSLIFEGNSDGELCLMAKTEMATITMRYKNLDVQILSQQQQQGETIRIREASLTTNTNTTQFCAACSIDSKKAAIFLTALQLPAATLECSISDDHLIHLKVNVRTGVVIHSILPALCI